MAEAKLVGMFLESKCDVCGQVLQKLPNKKEPFNFACPNCNSVLICVENKITQKKEVIEVGFLVLSSWKPEGAKKYSKHLDGDIQNNRLDNLEWSDEPDYKEDLGF